MVYNIIYEMRGMSNHKTRRLNGKSPKRFIRLDDLLSQLSSFYLV